MIAEKNNHKNSGFTLVELIVVLVILAILAAILIPALLGYIDNARDSKYVVEARTVLLAIQSVNTEKYATRGADEYARVNGWTLSSDNHSGTAQKIQDKVNQYVQSILWIPSDS